MTAVHYLKPDGTTLHGFFDKDLAPSLAIESGDTIVYQTLDSSWGIEKRQEPGGKRKKFTSLTPQRQHDQFGHALVGPLFIKGATPGSTLEIKINELIPSDYGWTSAGGFPGYWNKALGLADEQEVTLDFDLDSEKKIGVSRFGNFNHSIKLRPFMGIMGMPPNEPGRHSTVVPSPYGGNLDCKELTEGSTLYLPVPVEGGLFSTGDGHAVQGDGEVGGPALECGMERVELTFSVLDNMR
ncbi:acetamidase/formamidase family protein [Bacillus sp. AK031]